MESKADVLFFGGAAGPGKGLCISTPIPTPGGMVPIGEIEVGDTVFGANGTPCTVTAVSNPTIRRTFRLTFDDQSTIVADDVHRWLTFDANELAGLTRLDPEWRAKRRLRRPSRAISDPKKPWVQRAVSAANSLRVRRCKAAPTGTVRETTEILDTLTTRGGSRLNHAIQVATPLQLPDRNLPVDPYVLGVWLGDGASATALIGLSQADAEILFPLMPYAIKSRREFGAPKYRTPFVMVRLSGLQVSLSALGVLKNKHIPMPYLRASQAQRVALLQGLMDTDGSVSAKDGSCEFMTTDPDIRDGFYDLLSGLGIKARAAEGRARINGKDCGPKWRFVFTTPWPAFRLPRKADKQIFGTRRTSRFRYVTKVEEIDPRPTCCIAVDSPDRLYLAGHQMVPTHNTTLLLGVAATQHQHSIIFRRQFRQLEDIRQKAERMYHGLGTFNGQRERWRIDFGGIRRSIRFGAMQHPGDEINYQGQQQDFYGFDEITHFSESQFRFVTAWNRPYDVNQRVRVIAAGNPPTEAEGYWVVNYWAPWLDPKYPKPAADGELRWFAQVKDSKTGKFRDQEVDGPEPIKVSGEEHPIQPRSRTFIKARLTDNPIYMAQGYMSVLQNLEEPLRSQMLHGDFLVGHEDHPKQVIPTEWVIAAQARWRPKSELDPRQRMDAIGVDVARGGRDNFVLTRRYGTWFDEQIVVPGFETPDGFAALQIIMDAIPMGERPCINIDIIGVGAAVYDIAKSAGLNAFAMDARQTSYRRDESTLFGFARKKSEWWYTLREALHPRTGDDLAIPPDRELLADLTAPRYEYKTSGIQVEDKDDLVSRIGRSPDKGDSLVLAHAKSIMPIATHLL